MNRISQILLGGCFAAYLMCGTGCEDQQAREALKACQADNLNLRKTMATQASSLSELKAQLAQANAKVQELSAGTEATKAGKTANSAEEKGKHPEAGKVMAAESAKKGSAEPSKKESKQESKKENKKENKKAKK